MHPEDRVLVGVVNRKRDFAIARDEHWYRVPVGQFPRGANFDYIAFFLSGAAFKERSGGIHYFAEQRGVELAYRRDLLPAEANHKRAGEAYFKLALAPLTEKRPPVINSTRRSISFIYTTWDRFVHAQEITDLYSPADYFVDRIYHALRDSGLRPERAWEPDRRNTGLPPGVRILCASGEVTASPELGAATVFMDARQDDDAILTAIRAAIARQGGPVTITIPLEGR